MAREEPTPRPPPLPPCRPCAGLKGVTFTVGVSYCAAASAAAASSPFPTPCCRCMSSVRLVNTRFFLALRGALKLRGSLRSVRGQRGRRSTHSPSARGPGGASIRPSWYLRGPGCGGMGGQGRGMARKGWSPRALHTLGMPSPRPALLHAAPPAPPTPQRAPLHARPRHHHAIVGAEPWRWADQLQARAARHVGQAGADVGIAGHAAGDHQVTHLWVRLAHPAHSPPAPILQVLHRHTLEGGGNVGADLAVGLCGAEVAGAAVCCCGLAADGWCMRRAAHRPAAPAPRAARRAAAPVACGACSSIASRTAVFRPAYEKSQVGRRCMGTDSGSAAGSPSRANASSAAPPEGFR